MPKRTGQSADKEKEPIVAPGIEMDALEQSATPEEVRQRESTPVTKLFIDRVE